MTEQRIDHVAVALDGIAYASEQVGLEEFARADLACKEAQVHATLALVEQQKIANRIAIAQFRVGVNDLPHMRHLAVEPFGHDGLRPVADIREALGL